MRGLWAAFFIGGNSYLGTIERNGMTQKTGHGFGTGKQQGEWAELCFMARAAGHGLRVSKPYGDSASYDVGVEWVAPGREGRILRVQVKSTVFKRRGEGYSLNVMGAHRERYPSGVVDFFAIYLIRLMPGTSSRLR
jgi:PD-(D/E)XK endonuclease